MDSNQAVYSAENGTEKSDWNRGATAGLWNYAYREKLASIYKSFSELTLRTEVYGADALLRMVSERILDIAILFYAPVVPELTVKSAGKLQLVLASTIPDISPKAAVKDSYIYVDGVRLSICFMRNGSMKFPRRFSIQRWHRSLNLLWKSVLLQHFFL